MLCADLFISFHGLLHAPSSQWRVLHCIQLKSAGASRVQEPGPRGRPMQPGSCPWLALGEVRSSGLLRQCLARGPCSWACSCSPGTWESRHVGQAAGGTVGHPAGTMHSLAGVCLLGLLGCECSERVFSLGRKLQGAGGACSPVRCSLRLRAATPLPAASALALGAGAAL